MRRIESRVTAVQKQSDYPGNPDAQTSKDLGSLFDYVASHYPEPEGKVITGGHAGIAIMAHNPKLALKILEATHCLFVDEGTWGAQNYSLKELAVQVVNLYYKCDLCFQHHMAVAEREGISLQQQAALPFWRTAAHMYSDEQLLIIEYANAVCDGDVPGELFARIVKRYGEKGAVECAAIVAMWAFWAMILNATATQFDFGYGPPGA